MRPRNVTLLWALRSPCNLSCRYCYFGTVEEHRAAGVPAEAGALSHLSRTDLSLAEVSAFVATLADPASPVQRIFIAGGEPLIWPPILDVVQSIKAAEVEVVICTNGIPLVREGTAGRIVELGVDGVSVSLDSTDGVANDVYRPSRNDIHGWIDVVTGIQTLLAARAKRPLPRVGLYTVVTKKNIDEMVQVGRLAVELGCDYYVPQPISLAPEHALHAELSLTASQVPALRASLDELYGANLPLALPDRTYPGRFLTSIASDRPGLVPGCFGGKTLFFIEPDGSIWDCPSGLKIAATPRVRRSTVSGARASEVFTPSDCADCALFSRDCVNMWPLMDFGAFVLRTGAAR